MSMSIDISNSKAGIEDVVEYNDLSEEEQAKQLEEVENKDEAAREAKSDISKTKRMLRQIQRIMEQGELSQSEQVKAQELIEYLNQVLAAHTELLKDLKELKNSDAAQGSETQETTQTEPEPEEEQLEQDSTDGSPVTINGDEIKPGRTYTFYLRDGKAEAVEQGEEPETPPPAEGQQVDENGNPIPPENPEEGLDPGVPEDSPSHPDNLNRQVVTLNFGPDHEVSPFTYDPQSQTFTLRVKDSKGRVSYLKFVHGFNTTYVFTNGFKNLEQIKALPEELQKLFVFSGDAESFHQKIEEREKTPESERKKMDDYEAVTSDENFTNRYGTGPQFREGETWEDWNKRLDEQTAEVKKWWKEYADILFDKLREINTLGISDTNRMHNLMAKTWAEIFEDMKDLPSEIQSNIIKALIITFFKAAKLETFKQLFGYTFDLIIAKIIDLAEETINKFGGTPEFEKLISNDKLMILILEGIASPTELRNEDVFVKRFARHFYDFGSPMRGPTDYLSGFDTETFKTKDCWKDAESNVEALEKLKELTSTHPELQNNLVDGFTEEAQEALDFQKRIASGGYVKFDQADYDKVTTYRHAKYYSGDTSADKLRDRANDLMEIMITNEPVPASVLAVWMLKYINGPLVEEGRRPWVAGFIMLLLAAYRPDIFNALCRVPSFKDAILQHVQKLPAGRLRDTMEPVIKGEARLTEIWRVDPA